MICPNCRNEIPGAAKACDYCDLWLASTNVSTALEHEKMANPTLMRGIDKAGPYRLWSGLVMMVLILPTLACQAGSGTVSNNSVATEVVSATATVPQSQTEEVVQSIQEPTQEPTGTTTSTATPTSTDLPTPTATLESTITPQSTIVEPAPEPTSTPTQPPPTDTPTVVAATATPIPIPTTPIPSPTPQVIINNTVPELVEPTDNANISQDVYTFVWRWDGAALTDNQAFEVRIWREGEPHYGAFDARETSKYLEQRDTGNALSFSVSSAFSVQQNGNGEYLWSVAVVQLEPYQLVVESASRPLIINVGGGGDDGGHSYQ